MGGENQTNGNTGGGELGSSPRGRGKPHVDMSTPLLSRLIPAWAGKTDELNPVDAVSQAHPRVGGENARVCAGNHSCQGSSPRGRGKPSVYARCEHRGGLIPAWAGKTLVDVFVRQHRWAHPRVGGEN